MDSSTLKMTKDNVISAMRKGYIFGIDMRGVEMLGDSKKVCHNCSLYNGNGRFLPVVISTGPLSEFEISEIISTLSTPDNPQLWSCIDTYPMDVEPIQFGAYYSFYSLKKPAQAAWFNG